MNLEHWWLVSLWILFAFLHSLLAAEWVKRLFQKVMGGNFRFYRLLYSVFAFAQLGLICAYQYSISSPLLWEKSIFQIIFAVPVLLAGCWIMGASIRKYFLFLSGIDVFVKVESDPGLQQNGLHRWVRHPLYLGTLLMVWSLFIIFPYLHNLIACLMITFYTLIGIRFEEQKLVREFGTLYKEYSSRVPMLIPKLWKVSSHQQ